MQTKKNHWFLNILVVLTLIGVMLAFTAHYKNWIKVETDSIQILSGVYYKELKFTEINTVALVAKIPSLKRINGFSVKQKEKGVFLDSVTNTRVFIYVDNLLDEKIEVVYQDSLKLFLNFSDSTETRQMHQFLKNKIAKK